MDYLQLQENPVMSGSSQPTPSLGYSWHTNENRGSGIAVMYYEDRGMGSDEIIIAANDKQNLASAVKVFRDAGVVPQLKKQEVVLTSKEYYAEELNEASGYIPTAAQAHDPRYEMALTVDVRPGALGKAANSFLLNTDSQGHPQELRPDGLVNRMMNEYLEFKK
jgi:hypothetical protein